MGYESSVTNLIFLGGVANILFSCPTVTVNSTELVSFICSWLVSQSLLEAPWVLVGKPFLHPTLQSAFVSYLLMFHWLFIWILYILLALHEAFFEHFSGIFSEKYIFFARKWEWKKWFKEKMNNLCRNSKPRKLKCHPNTAVRVFSFALRKPWTCIRCCFTT